jgi:hypothetical protein
MFTPATSRSSEARSAKARSIKSPSIWAAAAVLGLASAADAAIVFVRASQTLATPQQTGASWSTAFKDLQNGLAAASAGDEIWISQGTYKPTSGTSRTVSFVLKNGVHLIGGFLGTETLLSQRDILVHRTILSGDIGGPTIADNSFHVVRGSSLSSLTILDGLTIQDGNANGVPAQSETFGPAVLVTSSSLTLSSCVIRNNHASSVGAILSNSGVADRRLTLFGCLLSGNQTGPAVSIQGIGGGTISQCTIANNQAGVVFVGASTSPSIVSNSILFFNGNGSENDQFLPSTPTPTVVGCLIQGWDNANPAASSVLAVDPIFLDRFGPDGVAGTDDDNLRLRGDSPAIDHGAVSFIGTADSLDVDDDSSTGEIYPFDADGNARRVDDALAANTGLGAGPHTDSGCFEYPRPRTILVNHAATGANNGTSWANAYTSLQSALSELRDPVNGGEGEIWVAQGTYKPTTGTDQTISFEPTPDLRLFGGFAGGELTRSARDWRAHPTILSGELGLPGSAGNSFHVVRCVVSSSLVPFIDGFTIRDGVCPANEGGGGVRFEATSNAVLSNCLITANGGSGKGAGVLFHATESVFGGGVIYSAIVGNAAIGNGCGGVAFENHNATLLHCVVAGNTSASSAVPAGVHVVSGTNQGSILNSCAVFDNRSGGVANLAAQFGNGGLPFFMASVALQGFTGPINGVTLQDVFPIDGNGGVVDANGGDGIYGTADDNLTPSLCSPLIDAGGPLNSLTDTFDLDEDGRTTEVWPHDLYRNNAFVDLPVPNVVGGLTGMTDIGPVERQTGGGSPDLNGNGSIDASDLGLLLGAWGTADSPFELTGDCIIDAADLAIILGAWGA